jgi:hypothetical protein
MSHVEGLSEITANLQKAMNAEIGKMNQRVDLAGDVLLEAVRHQASLTDHTYQDLAKEKPPYPYSAKYNTNTGPHKDDSQLHIQSCELYRNIEKVSDVGVVKTEVAVGVSPSNVPYIENVVYGIPYQGAGIPSVRPRPFLQRAFTQMKPLVADIIKGGTS